MEGSVEFTSNATKKSATIGANESMSATSSGLSAKSKFDFNKESSDWSILGVDRYAGYKKHIYLTVGKSTMLVEALEKEIDPGRGTSVIKQSGRTLLPIRSLIETMGGTVGWSQSDSKVTLTYNGTIVEMWVGNKTIKVNGISKTVDVAPMTINGRTMVPVRFASENLGATVDWVESTQTVIISYH